MIYLDNSATTKVCPEAVRAVTEAMQLDSKPGDVVGSYNVKLEAVDYHKQTTTTNTQELVATVDGSAPEFTTNPEFPNHGYVVDVNYHGGDQPSTDISGTIAWAKATDDDSEIAYYTVTLKDSDGNPVREVIIDHTGAGQIIADIHIPSHGRYA